MNRERFATDLTSSSVEKLLADDFRFKYQLGVQGFPALVLEREGRYYALTIGYSSSDEVLTRFNNIHLL